MTEHQKANLTSKLNTPVLGIITLIITIIALIPAFLSLNDKEAKIYYSVKISHINIPSTIDANQALSTLERANIPGSTLEISFINQGNAQADSVKFEIEVPKEIMTTWTEPSNKSKHIWVDIPDLKFSPGDKKLQAEIKDFSTTKPLRVLIGYKHDPNEKTKVAVFSNGKPSIVTDDINNIPPWSKWKVFYFPGYVFLGGLGLILIWSLIIALIQNPSFRSSLLAAFAESADIFVFTGAILSGLSVIIQKKQKKDLS